MYTKRGSGMARGASGAVAPGGRIQGVAKLIFKAKKISFCCQKCLQLLNQVKGNSINDCDLLKGQYMF